jgi:hypothetical protein
MVIITPSLRRKKKSKYKAVFLQKDKDSYLEIGSCFIEDIGKKTFSFKNHSYEINLKNKLFRDKQGYTILFYTYNGDMLSFNEATALMDAEELDAFIEQNIFGQLARALRESLTGTKGGWLVPIIIGGVLGGAIGWLVSAQYSPKQIQYVPLNQTGIPTAFSLFIQVLLWL